MIKVIALVCLLVVVVTSQNSKNRPTPVFLVGASEQAKEAFYNIISRDWTSSQKDKAIDALVAKLGSKVQASYAQFKKDIAAIKAKYGKSVEAQVT
ncbi:unnamed protein product [Enterobius vermicularis]|uniref:Apolipophorin-III n=1 Tax=Enterobius vermicularis TaxID=51028 RepID=A0A0N4VEC2_ENTVE|nr:unnamed protein product [Enterobius vermicularis]